jgi:DNA-directed RNA polymerase III subunit RPC2
LIQEQLSKNRIIVEKDRLGCIGATVQSSTHEKKSKTSVFYSKNGRVSMKHNSFTSDIPVCVILKALGVQSDKEIVQLVCGADESLIALFSNSVEECAMLKIFSQKQAFDYMGTRVKKQFTPGNRAYVKLDPTEEAENLLANTVLAHVPTDIDANGQLNYYPKAVYVALMVRRTIQAVKDGEFVDDKDFVGNKRLELFLQLTKCWAAIVSTL